MKLRAPVPVPLRLQAARLERAQALFNERSEVRWFGFEGSFEGGDCAVIRFSQLHPGLQGEAAPPPSTAA